MICPGHLGLPSPAEQLALARKRRWTAWSVRQVQQIVASRGDGGHEARAPAPRKMTQHHGGSRMSDCGGGWAQGVCEAPGDGKRGRIEIEYYSNVDLDRLSACSPQGTDKLNFKIPGSGAAL
jgi:hypothetical protein